MSRTWKQGLLALPGVSLSILPKLACPACWPAYAGLLAAVGLGFLISAAYLLPLTVAFLALALGPCPFERRSVEGMDHLCLDWWRQRRSCQGSLRGSPLQSYTAEWDYC